MKKFFKFLCVVLVSLVLVSACGKSHKKNSGAWDPDGQLTLNIGGEPTILNPILERDVPSSAVTGLIFNGLLKVNSNLEFVPDLASSYSVSADGKEYTFHLRKDVKWHDGEHFSASDVIFTINKILDKNTNTVRRSDFYVDGKPIVFTALDPYTVKAVLPKPFAPFLVHMTMGILPSHLLMNQNINTTDYNRRPIGTGPFTFSKWKPGEYVLVKRNDDYYGDKPKLAKILLKIIPDQNTALQALKKGEIDVTNIPPKEVESLKKNPVFGIYRHETLQYNFMAFNLKKPLFSDPRVRHAIRYAIDKEAIVKGVLKGYGTAAYLPSSPSSWAYPSDFVGVNPYNPAKAKQLLKEAGFLWNGKLKRFEHQGRPLEFNLITNKGNTEREKAAQMIQQFLADVGIKMNIRLMEWSSFVRVLNEPKDPKSFDAVMLAWQLGLDPDGYQVWHSAEYPKGFNLIGYSHPDVDELLIQGRETTKKADRKVIYSQLFKSIAADAPYIFLYYPDAVQGINRRVRGLSKPSPVGLMNEIEKVYVVD